MRDRSIRQWRDRRQRERQFVREIGVEIQDADGATIHAAPADVATSVRYLLARIQSQDVAGLPHRLGITSALRGEGVTYVSRTLAGIIAHDLRSSVCMVDLDWWAPDPGDPEPAEPLPGLADVVDGQATLDDVLVPTAAEGLWAAPAGVVPVARRPVVADDRGLEDAVGQLASRFDVLLLELPPLLETSDGLALSRLCDAYLLVVRHGVTTQSQIRQALDELSGAVCLGIVVNRFSSSIPTSLAGVLGR